jgi:uncharacterized heparinase superfamily protein
MVLFARTVRDVRASQVGARALLVTKRHARRLLRTAAPNAATVNVQPLPICIYEPLDVRGRFLETANNATRGVFRFLEREVRFDGRIDWRCTAESQLWRFYLNYCAVTLDLAQAFRVTGDLRYVDALREHIESWIRENRLMIGDPWAPYTASLRVVNWIIACGAVWDSLADSASFVSTLAQSVHVHLTFIKRNLEYDVRCNHLLENIKALIVGGIFLQAGGSGAPYFQLGRKLLVDQLKEQVLPDGGHCERSIMYHSVVLEDLLVIYEACQCADVVPPVELSDGILRMAQFLKGMTLPDGNIPLLNDSVEEGALSPEALIRWAMRVLGAELPSSSRSVHYADSGYVRVETPTGDVLLFDVGETGPKYQPGHGHADTLSIIWALSDGSPILIDPGVYEYVAGPWRDYFRGTRAHNTVQVDEQNSTEVWASFRAARKARILTSGLERLSTAVHVFGQHDGYARLPGEPLHRRDIYLFDNSTLLVLDTLTGSGTHLLESRQHFHPDCSVMPEAGIGYRIRNGHHSVRLRFLTPGDVSCFVGLTEPILGWFAPRFGHREPCPCVTWKGRVRLPYRTGFVLSMHDESLPFGYDVGRIRLPFDRAGELDNIRLGQL